MRRGSFVLYNFFQLLTSQVVVSLAPVILVPLYINYLGADQYGIYVLCFSLCSFSQVFIQYGFNFTANRALATSSAEEIPSIISSTTWTQWFIFLISILIFPLIGVLYQSSYTFFILSILIILSFSFDILIPQWKYHGLNQMEKFKKILIFQKSLIILLTIVILPIKADIYFLPIISIVATIFTLTTMTILGEKTTMRYLVINKPSISLVRNELKNGYPIFLSQIVSQVYVYSPKLILGKYISLEGVAIYDIVEKLLRLLKMPQYLLNQSLFPILAAKYSKNLINKYLRISMLLSLSAVIAFWNFKSPLISLFVKGFNISLEFADILIVTIPFIYITSYFGPLGLVVKGNDSAWKKATIHGLIIFFLLTSIAILFTTINLFIFSLIMLTTEFVVMLSSIIQFYRNEKKIIDS